MTGRATMLPVFMVVIIGVLAVIAITSGRSNAPNVVADRAYPHFICTFNDYCAGPACTREPDSFILYLSHADGNPRVEWPYVSTVTTLSETESTKSFTTNGGTISGTFVVNRQRGFSFEGTSVVNDQTVEHFGTGDCERLKTP